MDIQREYKVPYAHSVGAFFFGWFGRSVFLLLALWSVPGNALWNIPFTINPGVFLTPAACERHGGVSLAPMTPGIALKTAASRSAPLRLHLADRAGLDIPVSTCPLTAVLAVSPGCAPAFPPVFLTRLNPRRTTRLLFNSDIIAEGSSSDSSKSMEHRDIQRGVGPAKNR